MNADVFNEYMRNMSYRLGEGGRLDAKIEARRVFGVRRRNEKRRVKRRKLEKKAGGG